ncbi:MAG: hypothetical protein M1835_008043 [Candelina submexicana]|nr:MAG: hypothetical protein M1835_008043 [Candelina submexicana]
MLSSIASQQVTHRQSSISNSTSSSSVITVQRTGSISSTSGSRPPAALRRAQSPIEPAGRPTKWAKRSISPERKWYPSAAHSPPSSINGVSEGVGNLNRWSQSTTSSRSSKEHRRNSFSRRLSYGGSGPLSTNALGCYANPYSPPRKAVGKDKPSTGNSPPKQHQSTLALNLPVTSLAPIITLPTLSQALDAADSPSTVASVTPSTAELLTPSTFSSGPPDYFGEKWQGRTPQRPTASRTKTAPMPAAPTLFMNVSPILREGEPIRPITSSGPALRSRSEHGNWSDRPRQREQSSHQGNLRVYDVSAHDSDGGRLQSSASSMKSRESERNRGDRHPKQKAMLSKALQKANTAVLLDNALNFEGAMEAYGDACMLLQHVMSKSSGEDDRRKLESIRTTYTNRINELRNIDPEWQRAEGKELPARPESNDYKEQQMQSPTVTDDEDTAVVETATVRSHMNDEKSFRAPDPIQIPLRQQSLLPSAIGHGSQSSNWSPLKQFDAQRQFRSKSPMRRQFIETSFGLAPPMDKDYMPPPLSPRRPLTPASSESPQNLEISPQAMETAKNAQPRDHSRAPSNESTSWLQNESGSSSASSVHIRSSSDALQRKHLRGISGATEAEFHAALDAAVEAVYDDGLEPASEVDHSLEGDRLSQAKRNIELAKERVREAEREAAIARAKDTERGRPQAIPSKYSAQMFRSDSVDLDYDDSEAEEEERMLEEMTRGYNMDDFEFDLQSKSALPRQSDSSGFSGRTWESSTNTNPTTAGSSLQTVAETFTLPSLPLQLQSRAPSPHPPPTASLPGPPVLTTATQLHLPPSQAPPPPPLSISNTQSQSVRNRRLSGQDARQLKIETNTLLPSGAQPPLTQPPSMPPPMLPTAHVQEEPPKTASAVPQARQLTLGVPSQPSAITIPPNSNRQFSSPFPGPSPAETLPSDSPLTPSLPHISRDSGNTNPPSSRPGSPRRLMGRVTASGGNLRKNYSSSSLKNPNFGISNPDDGSPDEPLGNSSLATSQQHNGTVHSVPALSTPTAATFTANGLPTGGLHLFDSDSHSSTIPGSPNPMAENAPIPLEPCPDAHLLRPFWLMRCFYQTIAHPRGGYLSTKLFVPRDVWRVHNVKLKGLDEKVSSCDLLTAALLKLGQVDTCDADAVLEEMQSLESILDQAQASLAKKLGNEVGLQGVSSLFKETSTIADHGVNADTLATRSTNMPGKSYLSSWRKKIRKDTGPSSMNAPTASAKEVHKTALSMSTLPMTSLPKPRFAKRDVGRTIAFLGPNANYMGALARLCDAVQVLDQIARQVEDPGLKHSSQTHVGLELSTRHASEFFGFYICRFVLTDVGMMLDKFIKRGSEWVGA